MDTNTDPNKELESQFSDTPPTPPGTQFPNSEVPVNDAAQFETVANTPPIATPSSGIGTNKLPESAMDQVKTLISGNGGSFPWQKILLVLLALLVITVGGAAVWKFFLPKFSKPAEVALTYWGLWEDDNAIAELIADYQKTHPNSKITYQRQSPNDYRERLQSALARNEGPDIFRFHNTWVPMLKNELTGIPNTVFDAATFEATFYPVARNDLRVSNTYVGVPLEFDGLGLFVNEDIFKTAGKTFPKTWDELRQTALQLTIRASEGNIQVAGAALGRTENVDHWSDILGLMMLQNGAELARPAGTVAEDALAYFTIFSQIDKVWDKTLPSSTVAFAGGKLAMYFGPSWRVFEIKKINPNLNFQIVSVPQLPDANVNWASYWVEGVSKRSKYQAEAWNFLKYLSSKETMAKMYQSATKTRLFGEPYSRVDLADQLKDDQYVSAYIKQAPSSRSWYLSSRTFDNGINEKIIKYFEDAVNAVNQGKSAKEALGTTSQGVSQVLAQYGLSSSATK